MATELVEPEAEPAEPEPRAVAARELVTPEGEVVTLRVVTPDVVPEKPRRRLPALRPRVRRKRSPRRYVVLVFGAMVAAVAVWTNQAVTTSRAMEQRRQDLEVAQARLSDSVDAYMTAEERAMSSVFIGVEALKDKQRAVHRQIIGMRKRLHDAKGKLKKARREARLQKRLGHPVGGGVIATCPVAGPVSFSGDFGAPRPGGRTHEGIDMTAPAGTPVVAVQSGNVSRSLSNLGGMGVYVRGDNGDVTYYAHLSSYGQSGHVTAGTVIGRVGMTGDATGPHLHFEYKPGGGAPVDAYGLLTGVC